MSKADRLRNWSEPLSKSAIDYAGLDAYASLAICLALLKRKIVGEALTEADLGARVYLQQGKSRPFSGVVASALVRRLVRALCRCLLTHTPQGELGDITDFSVDAHASRRRFEAAPSELVVQVLEVHTPAFLMRKHGMTLGALRDQAGRDDDGTWRPFYVVVALNELVYRPELHPAQIVASLAERQHERTAPQLFRLERPDAFVLDASALDTATGVGADEQDGEDGQQDDDDDDDNDDDDGVAGNGDELEDLGQLALDDSDAEDSDDDRMPEDDL
jgi:hypothetical protein